LGLGHYARARNLSAALARAGFAVTLAHGGMPAGRGEDVPNLTQVQLPPAQAADLNSSQIRDADGAIVTQAWRDTRAAALAQAIETARPNAIVTESFPFARRAFAFEWAPILERLAVAPSRPLMIASLRDIVLRPRGAGKAEAMLALGKTFYDLLLVHGDPDILTVDEAFPELAELRGRTRYTGYVTQAPSPATARSGVLICAGGGAVGEALFRAALLAKARADALAGSWTVVTGPMTGRQTLNQLRAAAPSDLRVEGDVPDLAARFPGVEVIVAQAGYNTVVEALAARTPLVCVPYWTQKETEQTRRAERFAGLGLLTHLPEAELTPAALNNAIAEARTRQKASLTPDLGGAQASVAIIRRALAERRP
jgi:predicted glycosyltransferase